MKKARIIFAIIWSVISVLGIILWNFTPSHLVYFLFGFHLAFILLLLSKAVIILSMYFVLWKIEKKYRI